jgi:SAM-dependent methyltransferase
MEAMDLFWIALYDFHKWKYKWQFNLIDQKWNKFELDISEYFRDINNLNELEKELFKNLKWKNILDIGCWTAFYFPLFKWYNIEWIDISELAIKVSKENWIKNVRCENIFDKKINKKYDTITLLGNNLSIWWDINWTKEFLSILKKILKKDWKILSIIKKEEKNKYYIGEFICEYNGIKSNSFKWIRFDINFLRELLKNFWLKLKILKENEYGYCLEIKNNEKT